MRDAENPVLAVHQNKESNVFLMMRFRRTDYHHAISRTIQEVLGEYSLTLIRADENDFLPQLWDNVEACMDACSLGIAVFEQVDERDINPNVSLELGYMRGQRKKCLLLKESRLPTLQTDLSGYLHSEFDIFHIRETLDPQVRRWLKSLGMMKKTDERLLAFVSAGGTCRCAMAKAITEHLLRLRQVANIKVMSTAVHPPSLHKASASARRVIQDMFGEDLLINHKPIQLTDGIISDADLVLVMDQGLYDVLRKARSAEVWDKNAHKIHILKPFFGLSGDVVDPWPDDGSAAANQRYLDSARELLSILEPNLNTLISYLDQSSASSRMTV